MAKKSVEELDAELAALEAELAALETGAGEAPAPKKPKRGRRRAAEAAPAEAHALPEGEAPAEEPLAEAPKARRFSFGRKAAPDAPAAPEAAAPPEPEAKKPRFGLRLGKRGAEAPQAPRAEDVAPAPAPVGAPLAEAPPPPPPEPEGPSARWEAHGRAWRASPQGPSKVEVVRRKVDAEGRVVAEEQVAEELVPEPAPEPAAASGLLGRFRRARDEPAPEAPAAGAAGVAAAEQAEAPRRRRPVLVAAVLVVLALLVVAVVLPALGVDPLGTGALLGVGGSAGGAPVATFALTGSVAAVGAPVAFDASASSDPDGDALTFSWDFGDGSGDQGQRVSHSYAARGTYTATLTVRDATGREARFAQQVQVLAPPLARPSVTVGEGAVGLQNPAFADVELTFDGAGSSAEDASIAAYQWSFGDGSAPATGASAKHTYGSPGAYRASLVVTDSNGLRGNASVLVYVGERTLTTAEAPSSVDGRKATNHTVAVVQRGGSLGFQPVRLLVSVGFDSPTGSTPVGGVLPGGVNPDDLALTVYDASGAPVAAAQGAGPKTLEITSFGAPGAWNVEVARPQGGAQPIAYTLLVELVNGPP